MNTVNFATFRAAAITTVYCAAASYKKVPLINTRALRFPCFRRHSAAAAADKLDD